jgi:spore coat protein U-like protein
MSTGSDQLNYNLFVDASRVVVWGDGSGGSSTVALTAAAADIPVYGRVPGGQNVPAGSYIDTIVVTVTY